MTKISQIKSREILDSRGNPTVEVDLYLSSGAWGRAAVPSGASTGEFEAVELRDGDQKRYLGKGVLHAVRNVDQIMAPRLMNTTFASLQEFDSCLCELDGTNNKSKLGANAILGLSLAYAKALAMEQKQPFHAFIRSNMGSKNKILLPMPMMNILNGGAHADNNVDIQEFMILPLNFKKYSHALQAGAEIFHALKTVLKNKGLHTAVGDEGGFAPDLASNTAALDVICEAIHKAGYLVGKDIGLALDVAASEFFKAGLYQFTNVKKTGMNALELIAYYESLIEKYPIRSIEDGLDQNDWAGWKILTAQLGAKIQLVGDDLFVTNTQRLKRGIAEKVANSILIKPNQIGTLSETIAAIQMAQSAGYTAVISHRSGETEDTTIADLAVGSGAGQIKTGSLCRTDRLCKYNQLLRIEEELGSAACYNNPFN